MGDWEAASVQKRAPETQINKARGARLETETQPKFYGGNNKRQHLMQSTVPGLERETEELRHEKLPLEVSKLIMQARQSKSLCQKELAAKICERHQVITDYEAGRCIPNNSILGKVERAVGIRLRGKERGKPLAAAGKASEAPPKGKPRSHSPADPREPGWTKVRNKRK